MENCWMDIKEGQTVDKVVETCTNNLKTTSLENPSEEVVKEFEKEVVGEYAWSGTYIITTNADQCHMESDKIDAPANKVKEY